MTEAAREQSQTLIKKLEIQNSNQENKITTETKTVIMNTRYEDKHEILIRTFKILILF